MLFLQLIADSRNSAAPERTPITEATALALERALLAANPAERQRELSAALVADSAAASWAMRTAELGSSRTINHRQEAVAWISSRLESELGASLVAEESSGSLQLGDIEWRLPRLIAILAAARQAIADF